MYIVPFCQHNAHCFKLPILLKILPAEFGQAYMCVTSLSAYLQVWLVGSVQSNMRLSKLTSIAGGFLLCYSELQDASQ